MTKHDLEKLTLRFDEHVARIRRTLTPRELEVLDSRFGLERSTEEAEERQEKWLKNLKRRGAEFRERGTDGSDILDLVLKLGANDADRERK